MSGLPARHARPERSNGRAMPDRPGRSDENNFDPRDKDSDHPHKAGDAGDKVLTGTALSRGWHSFHLRGVLGRTSAP